MNFTTSIAPSLTGAIAGGLVTAVAWALKDRIEKSRKKRLIEVAFQISRYPIVGIAPEQITNLTPYCAKEIKEITEELNLMGRIYFQNGKWHDARPSAGNPPFRPGW